jgi:ribosomal protein S18 acetylase RimI-like enzyme
MSINIIPNQWETQHLVVKDSILDDLPELDHILTVCAYIEEWSGWESEPGSKKSMLPMLTEGELPPDGSKEFFRLQSVRLRDTGQMIGFLEMYHGFPTENICWITHLAINPEFQGKGYGQELVGSLSDNLKSLGYTAMRLLVDVKNWPALRFWSQMGFDKIIQYLGDKILSEKTFAHLILEKTLVS